MCYKAHDMEQIYFNYHNYSKYVAQKRNIIIYIIILIQGKYSDHNSYMYLKLFYFDAMLGYLILMITPTK